MGNKHAVITIGRFSPPTLGHKVLIDTVIKEGREVAKNSDVSQVSLFVFPTRTHDAVRNPLTYSFKEKILNKLVDSEINVGVDNVEVRTVLEGVTALYDRGFNEITCVVGSDRVVMAQDLLDKYNGNETASGDILYEMDYINVVQAGTQRSSEMDPDDPSNTSHHSATRLREAAKNNDFDTFLEGFYDPSNKDLAKEVFKEIQIQMGIEADEELVEILNRVDKRLQEERSTRSRLVESTLHTRKLYESNKKTYRKKLREVSEGNIVLLVSEEYNVIKRVNQLISKNLKESMVSKISLDLATAIGKVLQESEGMWTLEVARSSESRVSRGIIFERAIQALPKKLADRLQIRLV